MSSSKTINISPQLFKVKSSKPTRKHVKHQSNKINKHKLINRLKHHMSTQKNHTNSEQTLSNFDKHLSYFQKLNKERKKTRSRNKKENVFTALPVGMKSQAVSECLKEAASHYRIKPAPEYGILKGATKPTMREWKRSTQKNMHYVPAAPPPIPHVQAPPPIPHVQAPPPIPHSTNLSVSSQAHTLAIMPPAPLLALPPPALPPKCALAIIPSDINPSVPPTLAHLPLAPPLAHLPLAPPLAPPLAYLPLAPPLAPPLALDPSNRKTFLLGKRANKIGVLIKNNCTRKRIKEEINILNAAPIYEVKEYLKKHQLYKAGNNTPQDVLREIYKSAHLAGKPVKNKSAENLLHNFYKL